MAVGHDEEAYPRMPNAVLAEQPPPFEVEEKPKQKKDRGPYNRMWPKRFTVTFWTMDLLLFIGWFAFSAWCINWSGVNDNFIKYEYVPGDPWTPTAYKPSTVIAWAATIMVVTLLIIALEIATIVQCCKDQMRPSLWLSFQIVKLLVYVAAMTTTLITNFALIISLSLGGVISALSFAQLVYGAVVVHRNRKGFYEKHEKDLYDDDGLSITPDLGPYNRMWPKRFVITWWTLDLFCYTAALGLEIYSAIDAQGNTTPTIVHALFSSFLIVSMALDVSSIVMFHRDSLWPMLYLTFQVGKTALFLIASVICFIGPFFSLIMALTIFSLSIGPLVFGAVVVHRNRQGFYRENWPVLAPLADGQEPAPTLQQVCCECGMNRVHDGRSMYSRSMLTPRTGRDSLTLAAYSINSAGEVVRPGMATPPYSFKGIPEDEASIIPVTSNRQSRATFTSAEMVAIQEERGPVNENTQEERTTTNEHMT